MARPACAYPARSIRRDATSPAPLSSLCPAHSPSRSASHTQTSVSRAPPPARAAPARAISARTHRCVRGEHPGGGRPPALCCAAAAVLAAALSPRNGSPNPSAARAVVDAVPRPRLSSGRPVAAAPAPTPPLSPSPRLISSGHGRHDTHGDGVVGRDAAAAHAHAQCRARHRVSYSSIVVVVVVRSRAAHAWRWRRRRWLPPFLRRRRRRPACPRGRR